jgi:uncharacterized protein (DUF4415 family)
MRSRTLCARRAKSTALTARRGGSRECSESACDHLLKSQISFRIDNDVLAWLKAKGDGHLSRINAILRERMENERR